MCNLSIGNSVEILTRPFLYSVISDGISSVSSVSSVSSGNSEKCHSALRLLSVLLSLADEPRVITSYRKIDMQLVNLVKESDLDIVKESLDCLLLLVKGIFYSSWKNA